MCSVFVSFFPRTLVGSSLHRPAHGGPAHAQLPGCRAMRELAADDQRLDGLPLAVHLTRPADVLPLWASPFPDSDSQSRLLPYFSPPGRSFWSRTMHTGAFFVGRLAGFHEWPRIHIYACAVRLFLLFYGPCPPSPGRLLDSHLRHSSNWKRCFHVTARLAIHCSVSSP